MTAPGGARDMVLTHGDGRRDRRSVGHGFRARIGAWVATRFAYLHAWHQTRRARRNPAALGARLRSARTILIVCHGNIIRSPFAARLLAKMLGARRIAVLSAGMEASPGKLPDPAAVAAASRAGIDLRDHRAARVTPELVAGADVIFVMDVLQFIRIRQRFPLARARTFMMSALCRGVPLEIRDPFGRDAAAFEKCYAHIFRTVTAVVRIIAGMS